MIFSILLSDLRSKNICQQSFKIIFGKPEVLWVTTGCWDPFFWNQCTRLGGEKYSDCSSIAPKWWLYWFKAFSENRKNFLSNRKSIANFLYQGTRISRKIVMYCHYTVSKLITSIFWKTGSTNTDFRSKLEVDDRFIETGIVYLVDRGTQTVDIYTLDGQKHDFSFFR